MRKLKYIKLFEAFDSIQLSKTMKFVKKDQKERFLNSLKGIMAKIDAPLSSLNDDNFQYLPYKKAVSVKYEIPKIECDLCGGTGKVTKAWGSGTRNVKCTNCGGEGELDAKPKTKYFKFWFNADGDFIGTTLIDGLYHANKNDVKNFKKIDITEDMRTLSVPEIKSKYKIVNGQTKIYVEKVIRMWNNNRYSCMGTAFIDRDGQLFVINSTVDTHAMPVGRKWKDYGRYAVNVIRSAKDDKNGPDSPFRIYLATDMEEKEDIYWNVPVDVSQYGWRKKENMSKEFLNDAQFAIVFDIDSFAYPKSNSKSWNPVSITKSDREDAKKGATALMSNADIKNMNIERYLKTISQVDLAEGLKRVINKIPKIYGGDLVLYFIIRGNGSNEFKKLMNNIYNFMKAETDDYKKNINIELSNYIRDVFETSDKITKLITKRMVNNREVLEDNNSQALLRIVDKVDKLSKHINKKLLKSKIETINDMEILLMKINGIKEIINSDRFDMDYYIKSYIEYIGYTGWRGDNAALDYLRSFQEGNFEKEIKILDRIIALIDSM